MRPLTIAFPLLIGCTPDLSVKDSIRALTSVDQVQPRVDDRSSMPQAHFESVSVSLAGVGFKGEVSGDGEVWDGDVKVKGFIPLALDGTISAEVKAKYRDIEVLDSGLLLDGKIVFETGADFSSLGDPIAWLDLEGTMKADDGEQVGKMSFEVSVDISTDEFDVLVVVNEEDVTDDFLDGEFTSFLAFHGL